MDDRVDLISQFLSAYQQCDHATMAQCYHEQATFQDIAFQLAGKRQIHAMWHMICDNGIDVVVDDPPKIDGDVAVTKITDTYILSSTGRKVANQITCCFKFGEGLIMDHRDECDPIEWARQGIGGAKGWLAGRIGLLRGRQAQKTLGAFVAKHPEYRTG